YTGQSTPYAGQIPEPSAGATVEPRRHVVRRAHRARHAGHMRMHRARSSAPDDNVANQLNAQQLGRMGGGPGVAGPYGAGYGQPSPTQGMPGAYQPSASSHPPGQMR